MKVEQYVISAMLDLLEEGDAPDEMAINTFTDFYDFSLSAEDFIRTYWAELYPYLLADMENPIKYPALFREDILITIAYDFLSSFSAQTLHDINKVKSILADAKQLFASGYYMANVKSFIKNA